jgi:hypothetical protein
MRLVTYQPPTRRAGERKGRMGKQDAKTEVNNALSACLLACPFCFLFFLSLPPTLSLLLLLLTGRAGPASETPQASSKWGGRGGNRQVE